jgi:hypothetical protein
MVGIWVCSKQCLFCLHNNDIKRPLLPIIYDLQVPRTFPKFCQDIEKIDKQLDILCGVKVSLQCWVCYDIFLQRLVILSSMYNYGAKSPTWILALAKLTREGLFESYQLMHTSSATTSTVMKWCHSVRLIVAHQMHLSTSCNASVWAWLSSCVHTVCVCGFFILFYFFIEKIF